MKKTYEEDTEWREEDDDDDQDESWMRLAVGSVHRSLVYLLEIIIIVYLSAYSEVV